MSKRRIPLEGKRYGKLLVIEYLGNIGNKRSMYLCVCDCGNETTIWATSLRRGDTTSCRKCNTYKLHQEDSTLIVCAMRSGLEFIIDSEDFDKVSQYTWHGSKNYVQSTQNDKSVLLHRLILGVEDSNIHVDHIDLNPLNNSKKNLRLCNNQQNHYNMRKQANRTSQYKGVCWYKYTNKWKATICHNRKTINIGYYTTEEEAALAYNEKAKKLFGEFAKLNTIAA